MERALVVDDDSGVLGVTSRCLQAAGYRVATSGDFELAKIDIRTLAPHLVVLDIRLGEFNGLQLGILAREVRPDTRVVMMSGWDDPVLRREAARLGMAYVPKPFGATELLEAIQGTVTNRG